MKETKPKKIQLYKTISGDIPYLNWFDNIKDSKIRHRIRARLDRVTLGNLGDYKTLSDGILELRFKFGSGYRIYFAEQNDHLILLLCGGDKGSQEKDIDTAKQYLIELQGICNE